MNRNLTSYIRRAAGAATLGAVGVANAAAVDVAAVTSDIGAQAAPILAIGGAVLLIVVGVKAFKWVRAAMS